MAKRSRSSPIIHVVPDPSSNRHRSAGYHPERPQRAAAAERGVRRGVGTTKVIERPSRSATLEEARRAHSDNYLADLQRLAGRWTALDCETYMAPHSVSSAFGAAGSAIVLVEGLLDAPRGTRGVALPRPPGHHATHSKGMGFCVLNNVAIAAHAALQVGLSRVAIVDTDVHHGNGTQDIFWNDDRVLFVSLHEMPAYPGSGAVSEVGDGKGRGTTLNLPLPPGATDAVYRVAFDEVVLPCLRRFAPELVLLSAGFDAHVRDPLSSMRVTELGFGWMTGELAQVADESAEGRLGLILEGGYDLPALEASLEVSVAVLTGAAPARPEGEVPTAHLSAIRAAEEAAHL